MKKKALSIILVLTMIFGMTAITEIPAFAEIAHTHEDAIGSEITFKSIDDFDALKDLFEKGGNGYLTDNIDCTAALTVEADVNLCLNDKVIDLKGKGNITVGKGISFALFDCGDTVHKWEVQDDIWVPAESISTTANITKGGCITGGTGTAEGQGGGVFVNGTFIMYGGNIVGNKAVDSDISHGAFGGGVCVGSKDEIGEFYMYGGSIVGNLAISTEKSSAQGGGVELEGENSIFEMFGGEIRNNTVLNNYYSAAALGGGVNVVNSVFRMTGGKIRNNIAKVGDDADASFGGGVNIGKTGGYAGNVTFEMTGGEITGNTATYGGGIQSYGCVLKLNAAEGSEIRIAGNDATETEGGIANWGTMELSGKVIIRDNTCTSISYPQNLATTDAISITGVLTGSDIYITYANAETDEHTAGILTSGYTDYNPDAEVDTFFTYDGTDNFGIVLNGDGELEVVDAATLLIMAKEEAINAVNALVSEDAADEVKAAAKKAVKDITNAEDLTALNEIKTAAIKEIEYLKANVCEYCGRVHRDFFDKLRCILQRFILTILDWFLPEKLH